MVVVIKRKCAYGRRCDMLPYSLISHLWCCSHIHEMIRRHTHIYIYIDYTYLICACMYECVYIYCYTLWRNICVHPPWHITKHSNMHTCICIYIYIYICIPIAKQNIYKCSQNSSSENWVCRTETGLLVAGWLVHYDRTRVWIQSKTNFPFG